MERGTTLMKEKVLPKTKRIVAMKDWGRMFVHTSQSSIFSPKVSGLKI